MDGSYITAVILTLPVNCASNLMKKRNLVTRIKTSGFHRAVT